MSRIHRRQFVSQTLTGAAALWSSLHRCPWLSAEPLVKKAATDRVVCLNHHVCCAGHPEAVSRDPAFVALFGSQAATAFAIYHHHHDHQHDAHGDVVPVAAKTGTDAHG